MPALELFKDAAIEIDPPRFENDRCDMDHNVEAGFLQSDFDFKKII
jgi:hypothetical protein